MVTETESAVEAPEETGETSLLDIPQDELLLDTAGLDLLSDLDSTQVFDDQEAQFYRENPFYIYPSIIPRSLSLSS